MKKLIAVLLVLRLAAACAAAAAEDDFMSLTGLDQLDEEQIARNLTTVEYAAGSDFIPEQFRMHDRVTVGKLWDAVRALRIGEPTEAPEGATPSRLTFQQLNGGQLEFVGHVLKTSDGSYYTLENDGQFWETVQEMTDRFRMTVHFSFDMVNCVLGETTPQDIIDNWYNKYTIEQDGTVSFANYDEDCWFYVNTEHGRLDEPIITLNAFWYDYSIEYCGFDGGYSDNWEYDSDIIWATDGLTLEERDKLLYNEEITVSGHWDALGAWLTEKFGAVVNEDGILEAQIPLSDGRTLYVQTNNSPPRVSLLPD